jgi:hypothetical protein
MHIHEHEKETARSKSFPPLLFGALVRSEYDLLLDYMVQSLLQYLSVAQQVLKFGFLRFISKWQFADDNNHQTLRICLAAS